MIVDGSSSHRALSRAPLSNLTVLIALRGVNTRSVLRKTMGIALYSGMSTGAGSQPGRSPTWNSFGPRQKRDVTSRCRVTQRFPAPSAPPPLSQRRSRGLETAFLGLYRRRWAGGAGAPSLYGTKSSRTVRREENPRATTSSPVSLSFPSSLDARHRRVFPAPIHVCGGPCPAKRHCSRAADLGIILQASETRFGPVRK